MLTVMFVGEEHTVHYIPYVIYHLEVAINICHRIGDTNNTATIYEGTWVRQIEKVPPCSTSCILKINLSMTMTFE